MKLKECTGIVVIKMLPWNCHNWQLLAWLLHCRALIGISNRYSNSDQSRNRFAVSAGKHENENHLYVIKWRPIVKLVLYRSDNVLTIFLIYRFYLLADRLNANGFPLRIPKTFELLFRYTSTRLLKTTKRLLKTWVGMARGNSDAHESPKCF